MIKPLILGGILLQLILGTANGQGVIHFVSFAPPYVDAAVRLPTGELVGSGWFAQLYATPSGQPLNSLQPQFPIKPFQDRFPGYIFEGETVDVTGSQPGMLYTVVMRAFNGATYESSLWRGESKPINIVLGSHGGVPPANLEGLESFEVTLIPEPSSMVLGVLGICILAWIYRSTQRNEPGGSIQV